jgi:hypothetical protein
MCEPCVWLAEVANKGILPFLQEPGTCSTRSKKFGFCVTIRTNLGLKLLEQMRFMPSYVNDGELDS